MLQRILAVGNAMNAGTSIGDARGIRLGSLLAIVKTCGNQISGPTIHAITELTACSTRVLDYVVQDYCSKGATPAC